MKMKMKSLLTFCFMVCILTGKAQAVPTDTLAYECSTEFDKFRIELERRGRSGFFDGKLTYSGIKPFMARRYQLETITIDDALICMSKKSQETPLVVKCKSNNTHLVSVPRAGVWDESKQVEATFEVKHNRLIETTVNGPTEKEWNTLSYSLHLDFEQQIEPIKVKGVNERGQEEEFEVNTRRLSSSVSCKKI